VPNTGKDRKCLMKNVLHQNKHILTFYRKRDLMLDLDIKNVNLYEHFLHAVIGISSQNVNLYANGFQVLPHSAIAISSKSFYNFASNT
jgi:hypothetical protein